MANKIWNRVTRATKWLAASGEEIPGRASGKALTIFMLVLSIILTNVVIILFKYIFGEDLTDKQVKLIDSFYTLCELIIPILYGVKLAGKTKWMAGNDTNINPNTTTPAASEEKQIL